MKILTLDLSTKSSGYAIGEDGVLKSHGCITASSRDVEKRIIKMREQIKQLIKNNKIDKVIMEQVLPQYNSRTNKVLMWLQGAIVIAIYQFNSKIQCEFTQAVKWRAAIKIKQGRGVRREQLKPQDIQYVYNKYGLKVNDDQADAICIFDAYWEKNDNQINWE